MNCPKCGSEIKDNQKFCPKCGEKLITDNNIAPSEISNHSINSKKIVIVFITFICIAIAAIIIAFTIQNENEMTSNEPENVQITNTTQQTETTTMEQKLSDDCTYILADGYDGDDYYELVANQIDNYPESKIEMGVIKNNEWLIEMSSDFPFLYDNWFNDKDAPLRDSVTTHDPYERGSYHFEYVGEGTFYYYFQEQYVAYQANQTIYKPETGYSFSLSNFFIEERSDFLNDGEFLATDVEKGFCYYNLNTGEIRPMGGIFSDGNDPDRKELYGIHDGLFYAAKYNDSWGGSGYSYEGFFNLNGEQIIDLTEYHILDYHDYRFQDGEYTITCSNDNGVKYNITFDTTGKIISQEKPLE